MTISPPIQLLVALWSLWQSLAADGAARLREESGLDLKEFIAAGYLQSRAYSPAELAVDLQMPRYEVSRLLGSLEEKGFVQRTRGLSDRRQVVVELTASGLAAWQQGLKTAEAVTEPYLSVLDRAKREDLILTLAGLVRPT
ncbi:MarR family transcriptional regulator [Deinococcus sp.]|uniref:MarR family winged helix-turn-helix transcriptional regulator n=1 Tax=Deinococcus sp. TaxID=47478 RepID=UPI0025C49141|nr:MarR family transcriptional regulator [Deinococcus sp.]